jgi:hypothetical protein
MGKCGFVRLAAVVLPTLAGLAVLAGCGSVAPTGAGPSGNAEGAEAEIPVPPVRFTDITLPAGIHFRHTNGAYGKKLLPETMGSGVAVLDYNGDGKPDLLFVNSCYWPGHEEHGQPSATMALYRNDGNNHFTDVTTEVGLAVAFYGMGVTVGDYDNDGWPDLFITGVGGNHLFRNLGGRRFQEVTAGAGDLAKPGGWPRSLTGDFADYATPINWSTSAAFFDYDGDGKLDLFVCNYVTWSPRLDSSQGFALKSGDRAYGPPRAFEGTQCFLYRNRGDGTFEDVSEKAGILVYERGGTDIHMPPRPAGKALGVIVCDVDGDGWPDVIVANDTARNFFFHNVPGPQGTRIFQEIGGDKGVAYAEGQPRGAMGIDWGEYRPGCWGVLIGNFADEPDTLLRLDNPKTLDFTDVAMAEGLAVPSRSLLKFGTFFFDYDNDGRLDILTCNGHLEPAIGKVEPGQTYAQPLQLFWNCGGKVSFVPVRTRGAGDLFRPLVGRGCAYADLDGDGDLDVVLTENGGPARLLRNDGGNQNHWIRLVLEGDGVRSNRSAIGAAVTVEAGGMILHREVTSARGYLSQCELPLTIGLGPATKVDRVTIRWPGKNAGTQVLTDLPIDQVTRIHQN